MLDDADEKQHTNGAVIKQWLDDLRDLAYDVEDILDEFTTEALLRKLKGENQASTRYTTLSLLVDRCQILYI
jgi:hypothetical protein